MATVENALINGDKPGFQGQERRGGERRQLPDRRAEARFESGKRNRRSGRGRRGLEVFGLF